MCESNCIFEICYYMYILIKFEEILSCYLNLSCSIYSLADNFEYFRFAIV